ncbi:LINE-1 retrotransposable element ORF2 protein [Centroberyx affinis]|uniref:LINE-1 retrotransposable element ORF2 protein n=1 Tax=Centroberyx affinis TaxID=166261 RepID=UPI003A5C65CB
MGSEGRTVIILSWNVNGFRRKKTAVLNHLNVLQADIVFLQETHVGPSKDNPTATLTNDHELSKDYSWAIFTVYRANCRGVAVLIRRDLGVEGITISGDTKGRYMVLSCTISGEEFVFVNVYCSKDEKIDFAADADFSLRLPKSGNLIIAGDFNTVLAQFDKTSSIKNRSHNHMLKALRGFLEVFDLVDVWRCLYPEEKCFTFFDDSRKGKSRLDYFFVPREVLNRVRGCKIHARPQHADKQSYISDHAPISIKIRTDNTRWQFDKSLLDHNHIVGHLSDTIQNFSGGGIKRKADLWPCLKIRLGFEAISCKRRREEQEEFEASRQDTAFLATMTKHKLDGTEKSFILQKKQTEDTGSTSVKNAVSLPALWPSKESDIMDYLDQLHNTMKFEELQSTLRAVLVEKITKKEILSAILSLSDSGGPHPDGLPVRFYQHFTCLLLDCLQTFFNHLLSIKAISANFNESLAVDPTASSDHIYCKSQPQQVQVQNYSPQCVFNTDYKILTTILAERLCNVMEHVLNPGQHRPGNHVQVCIDAFKNARDNKTPTLVVGLKVDPGALKWTYLFQRLRCYKLPKEFQALIKRLLKKGKSLNGLSSELNTQDRGLIVGCPLTPLLVRLCLHPLIQTVNKETLQRPNVKESERTRALMDSDKAVFFIPNQGETVQVFEEALTGFMSNSGLMVDYRYSEILTVGFPGPLCSERLKQFKRVTGGLWCYGHYIG